MLRLYDEAARWGDFPELEAWLVRRRIVFDRFNERKYEISAERLVFRPDWGSVVHAANAGEQVVCEAEPLWPLRNW